MKTERCPPRKGVDTDYRICNEKCCDECEDLLLLDDGQFVQYVTSKSGKRLQSTIGSLNQGNIKYGNKNLL